MSDPITNPYACVPTIFEAIRRALQSRNGTSRACHQ